VAQLGMILVGSSIDGDFDGQNFSKKFAILTLNYWVSNN